MVGLCRCVASGYPHTYPHTSMPNVYVVIFTYCWQVALIYICNIWLSLLSYSSINHKKQKTTNQWKMKTISFFFFTLLGHRATGCDYVPLPKQKKNYRTPCKGANKHQHTKIHKNMIRTPNSLQFVQHLLSLRTQSLTSQTFEHANCKHATISYVLQNPEGNTCHHVILLPIYRTNSPMRKPRFWSCFRSTGICLSPSVCLCCLPVALLLVLVGFPHIYGGVIIGGPGG